MKHVAMCASTQRGEREREAAWGQRKIERDGGWPDGREGEYIYMSLYSCYMFLHGMTVHLHKNFYV